MIARGGGFWFRITTIKPFLGSSTSLLAGLGGARSFRAVDTHLGYAPVTVPITVWFIDHDHRVAADQALDGPFQWHGVHGGIKAGGGEVALDDHLEPGLGADRPKQPVQLGVG